MNCYQTPTMGSLRRESLYTSASRSDLVVCSEGKGREGKIINSLATALSAMTKHDISNAQVIGSGRCRYVSAFWPHGTSKESSNKFAIKHDFLSTIFGKNARVGNLRRPFESLVGLFPSPTPRQSKKEPQEKFLEETCLAHLLTGFWKLGGCHH